MVKIRIEPCLVLGSTIPTELYQPTRKNYRELVRKVDAILKPLHIPYTVDAMKISRLDCTVDQYYSTHYEIMEYLRILKKGCVLPRYKLDSFKKSEKKAKDVSEANKHSFRQQCKSSAFFVYDKISQLEMTKRLSDYTIDKNVLRLEAELKRPKMKNKLGKGLDNYHYLKEGAKRAPKIIEWYLKRICKNTTGCFVKYAVAVGIVQQAKIKSKTRDRLIYLLRKTSYGSLKTAIDKTCSKFDLSKSQVSHLINKLNMMGINPITLPNSSKMDQAPLIYGILKR